MYAGNVNRCEGGPEKKIVDNKEKCVFWLQMFKFFFFLRKVAWMGKKSVYSICKTVLSVSISCSYPMQTRTQCGAWPYSNTRESCSWSLVWSTSSFLSKRTLSYCILTEDFVCPYVTMKYLYHILSQESKPVWFGNLLLSKWNRDAVLNFPWCL